MKYYWRVCSLDSFRQAAPEPAGEPEVGHPVRPLVSAATHDTCKTRWLIVVETMPLFEWWPLQGANGYQVQISQDPGFASSSVDTQVPYPAFSPQESLGQRSLDHLGFGTYYWRVRGLVDGSPLGD